VFTILSSADVAILNMNSSQLANLRYFCAPVLKEVEVKIFWGSFANIFIDVPQFIIRVRYPLFIYLFFFTCIYNVIVLYMIQFQYFL
jgi:hypothetical protein